MESMSKSTKDDLAVAFRSLDRRRHEAVDQAKGAPVGELLSELDRIVAAAAALIRSAPTPAAVAAKLESLPIEEIDAAALDGLRRLAIEAGATLRRIAGSGPDDD
jgi:hypothetical protein